MATPVVKGDLAYLAGTFSVAPDSQASIDTVGRVRLAIHGGPGAEAIAGGDSATRGDVLTASSNDNRVVIPLILRVVLVILMALLRAVVAPLILIMTVVPCSRGGQSVGHKAWRPYRPGSHGRVITSAGLVLAGTFAVLATLPVVAFAEIGFTVARGFLLDTLIVRSVTALYLDIDDTCGGRATWRNNGIIWGICRVVVQVRARARCPEREAGPEALSCESVRVVSCFTDLANARE